MFKAPEYTPIQVCEAVCAIYIATDSACMDTDSFLGPLQTAWNAAQCLTACDNNYEVYGALNAECLTDLYVSSSINQSCPDLSSCI